MSGETFGTRRGFLCAAGAVGAGLLLTGCRGAAGIVGEKESPDNGEGVTPTEDLMREHGVLERVLLLYEEGIRRLDAHETLPPEALAEAAAVVRSFIEDYHEKQEEEDVFPRLEKAGKLADLTVILRAQHAAGRSATEGIGKRLVRAAFNDPDSRRELTRFLRAFVRMYRPHYASEDTVVFPALREVVAPREFDALGDKFEDRGQKLFGAGGFEKMVERVAQLEEGLGLADLAQFTPKP